MPPPARLLPLLLVLLFHLPVSLSSRHHHHSNPSPSPSAPPASSDAAPLAVHLACNATRFQPTCVSTLSSAGSDASISDLLAATLSALRARLPPAVSTAKSVLAASSNVNLSNAATNCLTLLSISSHRLAPSPSPSLLSASTALLHLYDCWSAYKYVNFSRTVSDAMAYLDDTIAVNSNYISMLAARQRYGDDTSRWAPPQTERNGYWPPAAAESSADVDALGVPKGLPANVTVCGAGCDYRTVREAVAAAPDYGADMFVVHVKEGVYKETVSVPWEKTNVVVVGDGMGRTVITGDLNADTPGVSTFNTATVGVLADGFMARDLTIANTAGPDAHQAVAFRSTGDRTVLDTVELLGHQDTLYAHAMRQLYTRCRVSGTVDFVFGNSATVLHDTALIVLPRQLRPDKGENDAVTAQGRTDPAQPTGIVLRGCVVNGSEEYLALYRQKPEAHRVYLGRPWKEYSRTVYVGCTLAEIVQPRGWMAWNGDFALKTLYYGEYDSAGPGGGDASRRVAWSSQVPKGHVDAYSVANFIQGHEWIPKV
ncbi:probable pectinesterase/pectinesterase inhibitor 51 [Phragmites australis]|uniref:probable pectinesterase/pectinesterase inhibitor 51 n=1 Tax=Phragmites australis TaxID=29695 RepID=UPI002D79FA12|nr:probable pectinesterase/pectinesterase inhibitor 51 [Phragmites australis]